MAARAIGAELSLVLVLMTGGTLPPQSQKRAVQILDLDFVARARRNLAGVVTALAFLRAMFSLQRETSLRLMVELTAVQARECEILPVMFHVAFRAFGLALRSPIGAGVHAVMSFDPSLDLAMAAQALEDTLPRAEFVAGRTLAYTFQLLVRKRKRARRYLRPHRHAETPGKYNPCEYPETKVIRHALTKVSFSSDKTHSSPAKDSG